MDSCAFPRARLAARDCTAFDVLHDDVATPLAQEDEVDLGDAHNARRVGIHDLGHLVLCEGLTQGETDTVFYPESRDACDLEADAILVVTKYNGVAGREVCRDIRGIMLDLVNRHS